MKFISYTNDGRVAIQHAALILSKLDEADALELHTMDNAIILLKKDMTRAETRDVLQGMVGIQETSIPLATFRTAAFFTFSGISIIGKHPVRQY